MLDMLKMPWTRRREREAAIAARQAEIAQQLEQRRAIARERVARINQERTKTGTTR
jgi:hypothetical protein